MRKTGLSILAVCCLALVGCGEGAREVADAGGADLLGEGHGIDHLVVAVRDLDASQDFFADSLGFTRSPRARFPGLESTAIWFSDTTYLELITVTDSEEAMGFMPQLPAFLEQHERGAIYLGLDVTSAEHAAEYLASQGFQMVGPLGGSAALEGLDEPPPEMWHYAMFEEPVVPANAIFFIQYDRAALDWMAERNPEFAPQQFMSHPNTALGIQAVWWR
jgi:catechol 2,3-dioxygenase-like lactoylglutathione lyase family enzyme